MGGAGRARPPAHPAYYAAITATPAPVRPSTIRAQPSGFFAGGWWRTPAAPYNARVQEHVYTLAWFATQARSWNPYRGNADSALRCNPNTVWLVIEFSGLKLPGLLHTEAYIHASFAPQLAMMRIASER